MMDNFERQLIIAEARSFWDSGELLRAGMVIYERIPLAERASWAGDILETVFSRLQPTAAMQTALHFARHPEDWPVETHSRAAHSLMGEVRGSQLDLPTGELYASFTALAECVVKITYTTQQYPAPFDHNAGWKIAVFLSEIATFLADAEFSAGAWEAFSAPNYIQLHEPITCHPMCPYCAPYAGGPRWFH